jgi:WD40 repeat protein
MGLMLLLATSLAAGTGMMAYPLQSEKQSEAKQATAPTSQERKSETAKPARDERAPTDLYGDPLPAGAIARLGTVRFRHGGWLRDVLISPDGRTLISAGDHAVEMWDAHTSHRRRRMVSPNPSVCGIALSPDGKILAVANSPFKMRFWDLSKDAEIHPFGVDAPVAFRVAFSPNGKLLATRDGNFNPSTVSIWDLRAKKKVRTIEGGRAWADRSLAFSPNSKLLAFPGETCIRVWDVAADKELNRLGLGTKTQPGSVVFSSDGTRLAAASYPSGSSRDHAIHLWDVATGREVGALAGHEDVITAFAMSPTSDVLASASRDRTIRLWDVALRREVGRFSRPDRAVVGLDFSANGNILVSGQNNGVLRLWDMRKRKFRCVGRLHAGRRLADLRR